MRHFYEILDEELQGFGIFKYTDVLFTFSGNEQRKITFRIVFCSEDQSSNSKLQVLLGHTLANVSVSIVSFYNKDAEGCSEVDSLFEKPPGAPDLSASETQYLYRTLIDIILQISQTEQIDILTFEAYSEKLNDVYLRLVRKYARAKNMKIYNEGAYYAVKTSEKHKHD